MQPLDALGGVATLLIGGAMALLTRPARFSVWVALLSAIGGAMWSFYQAFAYPSPTSILFSMAWGGGLYSFLAGSLSLLAAVAVIFLYRYETLLADSYSQPIRSHREVYALTLWAAGSLAVLAGSNHLLLSLVALETAGFALIILVGYSWADRMAPEAAVKYFLLSAVATAILVYGLSYVYGITGTLYLHHLKLVDWRVWQDHFLFRVGLGLILIGLLFKLSIFPLHWWAPDVYGGAVPGTAGIAAAFGKISAAFFLGQILHHVALAPEWRIALAFLAGISAFYGNLMAISQESFQRLLGYSSIAHGGYLLLGLVSGPEGLLQGWSYGLAYGLMSLIAFGLGTVQGGPVEVSQLRGLGHKMPGYGMGLALGLMALSGMPPLLGFFAKYGVFAVAFRAGYLVPATIALLGALIGYYAYWKPIAALYQPAESRPLPLPVLSLSVLLLVLLGLVPFLFGGWLDYFYGLAGYFQ